MSYIIDKTNSIIRYALDFYAHYYEDRAVDMLAPMRKLMEALFKIIIVKQKGEGEGLDFIQGYIDARGQVKNRDRKPSLSELWEYVRDNCTIVNFSSSKLYKNKELCNEYLHDSDKPNGLIIEPAKAKDFIDASIKLLYKDILKMSIPDILTDAMSYCKANLDESSVLRDVLSDALGGFQSTNRYVLIADKSFGDVTKWEKYALGNLHYALVLDFDPRSKQNGLHAVLGNRFGDDVITILPTMQHTLSSVMTNGRETINWVYADGMAEMPDTISDGTVRGWRSKNEAFIKQVFNTFLGKETEKTYFIYLHEKESYIDRIIECLNDYTERQSDLFHHVIIGSKEFTDYCVNKKSVFDINIESISCSRKDFCMVLRGLSLKHNSSSYEGALVPAVSGDQEIQMDESPNVGRYNDAGMELIHQDIHKAVLTTPIEDIPSFYQGLLPNWADIAADMMVDRDMFDSLYKKTEALLKSKKSSILEFYHRPGAGATVMAKQLAFQMRTKYPVVWLHGYKSTTEQLLITLSQNTQRPVLAIVESADVKDAIVERLRNTCATKLRNVVFLYIRVSAERKKVDGPSTIFLKEYMYSLEEKTRFSNRLTVYAKDKRLYAQNIDQRYYSETELLDFFINLDQENYSGKTLLAYVSNYVSNLSQEQLNFLVFVALYAQYQHKGLRDILFRKMFSKCRSFSDVVKNSKTDITKLIIEEKDEDGNGLGVWRPRYSRFAEAILQAVLGNGKQGIEWKDKIYPYAELMINTFYESNPYDNDDFNDVLLNLFAKRYVVEDSYCEEMSDFSEIMQDIADYQQQKSLYELLIQKYPSNPYLHGSYARFLYENHKDETVFEEADRHLEIAFANSNEDNYALLHLAGMCKNRQIYQMDDTLQSADSETADVSYLEAELQTLADKSLSYFRQSQEANPRNLYALVSNIQTRIKVLQIGKKLNDCSTIQQLITNDADGWYQKILVEIPQYIGQAKNIIEQQETLGVTGKLLSAKQYISSSEASFYKIMGKSERSLSLYQDLSESATRSMRGFYRNMYINTLLQTKTNGADDMSLGWKYLTPKETEIVNRYLEDTIREDPSNSYSFSLWLNYQRHSPRPNSFDQIISKLNLWEKQLQDFDAYNVEVYFYLYMCYAVQAIKQGAEFSSEFVVKAKEYIEKCKNISLAPKHTYIWLSNDDGIHGLVPNKKRDSVVLYRATGVIKSIESFQQGQIALPCGLPCFFAPKIGGFEKGKHEGLSVTFNIAFRHDCLMAWNVKDAREEVVEADNKYLDEDRASTIPSIGENTKVTSPVASTPIGLKIIGTVDLKTLSLIEESNRRRERQKNRKK